MNDTQLETQLSRWLAGGPRVAPERLALSAATYAHDHPRRSRLTLRSLFAGARALVRPTPVALRPMLALVLLGLTFALGAAFWAAWHQNTVLPVPSPTVEPSPGPAGYSCPAGTNPDQPGPSGQTWPWTGSAPDIGWGPLTMDAASGQLLAIDRDPAAIWAFDLCRNTWAPTGIELGDIRSPRIMFLAAGGTKVVIDAYPAEPVVAATHRLIAYDRATGQATDIAPVPFMDGDVIYRTVPGGTLSEIQVVAHYSSQLWTYDYGQDEWQQLDQLGDTPPGGRAFSEMAYDPATDRLLLYTRNDYGHAPGEVEWGPQVYEYDFATSTWTREADPTVDINVAWVDKSHQFAFDAERQQLVAYLGDNNVVGYDMARHQFDRIGVALPPHPEIARFQGAVAYDSLNGRVVIASGYASALDMVALDLESGRWYELLSGSSFTEPTPAASPSPLSCPPGADPNDPGPVGQQRPDLGRLSYDAANRRILGFGGGDVPGSIWSFDVCSNSWFDSGIALNRAPDVAIYQPGSNAAVLLGGAFTAPYYAPTDLRLVDLATGGVTELPQIPTGHMAVGGVVRTLTNEMVLIDGAVGLWTLDATAHTWVELSQTGDVPPDDAVVFGVAYDQSTDRLILYAAGAWTRTGSTTWPPRTYEYDFGSATWLRGEDPPDVRFGGYGHDAYLAYDEAHAQTVLVSRDFVAGYDSTAHTWETLLEGGQRAGAPEIWVSVPIVYDAVNQRIVAATGDQSMWAFDLDTRTWTSLLARPTQ